MQASVVALGWNRSMFLFGRINDREEESYEEDEGMSKMKDDKFSGLDQCLVEFLRKGS